MKIGIIGAGNIGGVLTRRLTALGHEVAVANSRGPETLTELADETGAKPVPVTEAARDAELVIVTIPQKAVRELPAGILDHAAANAVVIDTGNYYTFRDGQIPEIDGGVTDSRWVANLLGHPVIKAFNNIAAADLAGLAKPAGSPGRIALPIAGDDPTAKATVLQLIDTLGFDPVDAGTLDDSWRQQPGTPSYGTNLPTDALRTAIATATPHTDR